jgi:hypothetical protein
MGRKKHADFRDHHRHGSDGTGGTGGAKASATKSYHNGGVEGDAFAKWYDKHLAKKFGNSEEKESSGSGSGGSKGSGSGGSKGHHEGSGSGGSKGSGSGGSKGSGSGGSKGSGSGGSKGSGSGGSKGSGSGGSKGSGSGGSKGSGSGGSKGSGSGGSKGGDKPTPPDTGGEEKFTLNFVMGDPAEVNVAVTELENGNLFFNLQPTDYEDETADIDGLFFNLADDSTIESLNFHAGDATDIQASANSVTNLPSGPGVDQPYDVAMQFSSEGDAVDGKVQNTNFTLWSDDGPLTLDDIDLAGMRMIVNADTGGEVLGVSDSDDPDFIRGDGTLDSDITVDDVMSLMTLPEEKIPDEDPSLTDSSGLEGEFV